MNSRVDPSSSLREKNSEGIGDDSFADGLRTEDHLSLRESLEHERREVTILSEQEQVLLVKRVDNVLSVVLADVRVGQDGNPVAGFALGSLDTVNRETTGKTSHTSEHGFEGFGQVMRDIVLEH